MLQRRCDGNDHTLGVRRTRKTCDLLLGFSDGLERLSDVAQVAQLAQELLVEPREHQRPVIFLMRAAF